MTDEIYLRDVTWTRPGDGGKVYFVALVDAAAPIDEASLDEPDEGLLALWVLNPEGQIDEQ